MVYLYHTRCASSCQRGEKDVPSQNIPADPPCLTMGSEVSWDVHGDHGIPSRGDDADTLDTAETSVSLGEDGAPWHLNAAEKCRNGGKPFSVGGNALQPHAVPCPRYPRRMLTRSP